MSLAFLHADGYAGFGKLYQPATPSGDPALIEVACWSHARRKFYDVHQATASQPGGSRPARSWTDCGRFSTGR